MSPALAIAGEAAIAASSKSQMRSSVDERSGAGGSSLSNATPSA